MPGTGKEGSAAYFSSLSPPRFCVVETDKNGMALFASFLLEDAPTRSPLREIGSKDRLFAICDAPHCYLTISTMLALGDTRARSVRCLCRLTALNNGALCDVRRVSPVCVTRGIVPLRRRTQRRHHQVPHEHRAAVPAHPLHTHVARAAASCTTARSLLLKNDLNTRLRNGRTTSETSRYVSVRWL